MNYAVVWRGRAAAQLTALWIRAADKDAVTGYAEQIDRILARDPTERGESRFGNFRLWFHRPICVFYQVVEADKTVYVLSVKWVGR
jgi:hypothetical protein